MNESCCLAASAISTIHQPPQYIIILSQSKLLILLHGYKRNSRLFTNIFNPSAAKNIQHNMIIIHL